jgi:hypothetical protein
VRVLLQPDDDVFYVLGAIMFSLVDFYRRSSPVTHAKILLLRFELSPVKLFVRQFAKCRRMTWPSKLSQALKWSWILAQRPAGRRNAWANTFLALIRYLSLPRLLYMKSIFYCGPETRLSLIRYVC